MENQITEKELEQLMEKLFTIDPKEHSFFRECLRKITKVDEGIRLLHSLNSNFDGKKLILKTERNLDDKGYFSDNESEICIKKLGIIDNFVSKNLSLKEKENYPKALLHELTHWEQWQNNASGGNAITEEDKFFTVLMAEADAQASGDIFEINQKETVSVVKWLFTPAQQIVKFMTNKLNPSRQFIFRTQKEIKKNHPDWHEEQIKKEVQKLFFKKTLTMEDSYWRKIYGDPQMVKSVTLDPENRPYPKKEFPDIKLFYKP